jgi:EmrB/QacA subfamily drug resistance transporter
MTTRQRLTLIAVIIGSGAAVLDGVIVNLALPKIGIDLHVNFAGLQWVVDGYLLSLSALILLGGSLGDIFGRKRIYLLGVLGFGLTSLGCGLAPTASTLIIMRILQGIFGALLVPGALAIINTAFPRQKRGAAIASWSAWMAIFPPIGPLLGGYILDIASWRWIFLINVPLLAVCYLLAHFGAPESRDPIARKIDGQGAALAALSLAGLTYGLIQGPATHWNAQAWWSLLIGLTAALLWWRQERQTTDPMVPLKLFRSRNFSGANIMTFLLYGALGGILFVLVIYLQRQLHYSSLQAGVSTLPIPICIFFLSRYFSELCRRYGPRLQCP